MLLLEKRLQNDASVKRLLRPVNGYGVLQQISLPCRKKESKENHEIITNLHPIMNQFDRFPLNSASNFKPIVVFSAAIILLATHAQVPLPEDDWPNVSSAYNCYSTHQVLLF
jgi:hypothetical protein